MQKNILIPTDFSDNAWNAIIYALKLYANETCKFYLLNSFKLKASTMSNFSSRLLDTMREIAMEDLLKVKKTAEKVSANANHSFEIILSPEELKDAIESAIKKHQIEMIVLGTKGASGAKEFFFGSNTVKIISKIRGCPILTIPENFEFITPKHIAFPTDFNRFYDDTELNSLKDIAGLYNSEISILHINSEESLNEIQEYNSTALKNHLKNYKCSLFLTPEYTKKAAEINTFIKDLKINMLAMVNYKHSFIENITKEPIIKTIGFHPIVPFLVIPE